MVQWISERGLALGALAASVLVLAALGALWRVGERQAHYQEQSLEIVAEFGRLERSLGYVGFIHHFKNYILRTGEDGYADLAREELDSSLSSLDEIERLAVEMELGLDYGPLRETLLRYDWALNEAIRLRGMGLSPTEIDERVRVQDEAAATSVAELQSEQQVLLEYQGANTNRAMRAIQITLLAALGMLILLIVMWRRQHRAGRQMRAKSVALEAEQQRSMEYAALITDLKRSNQELDDFAYIASHDLKEPLRGIGINADFLLRENLPDHVVKRVKRMSDLAKRLDDLTTDLLFFSRIGNESSENESVDLNRVIEDIRVELQDFLRENSGRIIIKGPFPAMVGDLAMIEVALRNLIINGLRYNESPEKVIEIGCLNEHEVKCHGSVSIYVKDNGIGIPEHQREGVFRMFNRLHRDDRFGPGTGSGLAFARKIIERLGGSVEFVSKVGVGTTFILSLPPSVACAENCQIKGAASYA